MLRSAVLPTEEFNAVHLPDVYDCCSNFYKLFELLFGKVNCSYNLHLICCHLLEIRTHGPLTETSAFKFETFYGEMRRSFVPGTPSTTKQILKNVMLKRRLRKHQCNNNIFISNYETSLESNNIIYTYSRKEYKIYEIADINGENVTCHKIGKYPAVFQETPNLNWSTVGVFRRGGVSSEETILQTSDICGKVLNVDKFLITCPINVLNEK